MLSKFLILIFCVSTSAIAMARNIDLSLDRIAPESDEIPDPQLKKDDNLIENKSLTKLKMTDNVSLQPHLQYNNYLNIRPTKPQTFGLNLFWDI